MRWLSKVRSDGELVRLEGTSASVRSPLERRSKRSLTMVPLTQKSPASFPASLAMWSCRSSVSWSSCEAPHLFSGPRMNERVRAAYPIHVVASSCVDEHGDHVVRGHRYRVTARGGEVSRSDRYADGDLRRGSLVQPCSTIRRLSTKAASYRKTHASCTHVLKSREMA